MQSVTLAKQRSEKNFNGILLLNNQEHMPAHNMAETSARLLETAVGEKPLSGSLEKIRSLAYH